LNLFTRAVVAIDGSKFKAVNNRDKNFTVAKVGKRMEQVDASIVRYLAALDRADREESDVAEAKTTRIKDKIAGLRRQMQVLKAMEQTVQAAPDQQVSLTDPDQSAFGAPPRHGSLPMQCVIGPIRIRGSVECKTLAIAAGEKGLVGSAWGPQEAGRSVRPPELTSNYLKEWRAREESNP
jgi:hypothetical protein